MKKKFFLVTTVFVFILSFSGCTSSHNKDYYDTILQDVSFEGINIEIPIDWSYDGEISNDTELYYIQHDGSGIFKNMFYATSSSADDTSISDPKTAAEEYASGLSSNSSISNVSSPTMQTLCDFSVATITFNQILGDLDTDYFCKVYVFFKPDKIVSFALATYYDDFELFDTAMSLCHVDNSDSSSISSGDSTTSLDDSATMGEKNALSKALDYLNSAAFSYAGLIEQLEYEGFTNAEATYGADHCGADWNEQAALKAKDYIDSMSFSRQGLVEQLEYEGFTHEQAEYGVSSIGY